VRRPEHAATTAAPSTPITIAKVGSRKSEARRQIQMNSYTTAPVVSVTASNMLITLMLLFRERVDQLYERYSCKCLYIWHLLAERVGFEPTCRLPDKTLSRRPRYDHFGTSPIGRPITHTTVFPAPQKAPPRPV
jgi:hypothetical protein